MEFEEMERFDEHVESNHNHNHNHHNDNDKDCGCHLNCVCQVVRAIKDIQDEAVEEECMRCTSNCFIEPLGELASPSRERADTRVFTLTNKNGDLFKALFRGHDGKCVSVFFRVEDVFDNCCATLRVLIPLKSDRKTVVKLVHNGKLDFDELCSVRHWARSNSCITVDLHCFCAVQCIADADLEICE
ncbi:CotY/CotZ family spore coat protein [Lederbergia citrea]|uniref:Spore coat protein CotZ n=1 Tax=Lederbergia citrea TaxID=2833581 RepID=A0A942Z3B2_9BACI|nr:CotY/CotZ family spore coat protein [Lederbergia citrea]MBS4177385.1 spore coat protein CotZ [Lederbergia citrea]MBS4204063.1 spore coat protein CotZ [Lederbergia citrea]MBS4221352.1 spore coat protein CotZ [Lederbergia citrea]